MKKLPIGIQNLREIRQGGYCYVDKSPFVKALAEGGKHYFLSRPRRFGKSLFMDTLAAAFSGNRELFQGLFLENEWDWSKAWPVIRFDLGGGVCKTPERLSAFLMERLAANAETHGITLKTVSVGGAFDELIRAVHRARGPVVILVDEYDKPILDNVTEPETALRIRDVLRDFYTVIKSCDAVLKFVFLTGVSKFSKVNLFSGLNNLEDITLSPAFASICGYTQADLETTFADWLQGLPLAEVKAWYNGYNFLGEAVYNPFDILLFLKNRELRPYWFETGTPTFLVDLLRENRFFLPELGSLHTSEALLSSFDVAAIAPEALLFQTGYLTIHELIRVGAQTTYRLGYPNLEVRSSLNDVLLESFARNTVQKRRNLDSLYNHLRNGRVAELRPVFHAFFASIPHDWYRKNQLAGYEGFYASVFYAYFSALGLDLVPEDVTNHGRIDLTIRIGAFVYLFEFKVKGLAKGRSKALTQLKKNGYQQKYVGRGQTVFLVGVEFDPESRNITAFEWETPPGSR